MHYGWPMKGTSTPFGNDILRQVELCQNSELFKAPKRAVLPHFQLTLTSVILGSSSCNYADLAALPFSIKKAQARFNKYYFKGGGGGGGKGGR